MTTRADIPYRPWMRYGLCQDPDVDPAIFYIQKGATYAEAKAVCAECRVRRYCLDWALTANEREGCWGGTSPGERRRIKRLGQAARCA